MAKDVTITLPDGSKKVMLRGVTVLDVASSIGQRLAKDALVGKVNGQLVDLDHKIEEDCTLEIITFASKDGKAVFWHSSAHVLAMAVKELFPDVQLTIGPPIEAGFYYDFYFPSGYTFKPEDLQQIEKKFKEIAEKNLPSARHKWSRADAIAYYTKDNPNKFKVELINEFEGNITYYTTGKFLDLCRGPHLMATGKIKAVKLLRASASYWRGNSDRETLQRIYAITYPSQKELDDYLHMLEEAEKRDHRKIGQQLDLFSFHDWSPGSPFFHPKGTIMFNELQNFIRGEYKKRGYQEVITPNIFNKALWETSGHWSHYKKNMFVFEADDTEYSLKPMNCPSHTLIYKTQARSYKDLPLRLADFGALHRNELSGALGGLTRVRKLHQDDAHIFCKPEDIESEIGSVLNFVKYVYNDVFKLSLSFELSTRPEDSLGTDEMWNNAETALGNALKQEGIQYKINAGDGAFYGPKIDIHCKDALGRSWQLATIQLDFNMPQRFDLQYTGADDKKHYCVMVHRAVLGSLERFLGIMIEHFAGHFPLWLAPHQVAILPIADRHIEYADKVKQALEEKHIRVVTNYTPETVEAKVRDAQLQKIPVILIVGDKEIANNTVAVRRAKDNSVKYGVPLESLVQNVSEEILAKRLP